MARPPSKTLWSLVAIFALIACFWGTPVLFPLRVLVIFFHEASHGLVCLATGGSVDKLLFDPSFGGLAFIRGGSYFLAVNAGYVGSFLWGAAIILAAAWTKKSHRITIVLGAVLAAITLLYVRNGYGFFFGLATAACLIAAAFWLNEPGNDFLLKVIGLTSCGYAILDIRDHMLLGRCCGYTDATILAGITHVPAIAWGVIWISLTLVGMYYTLELAARADRR
jgi:hypothetical protein